VFRVIIVLENKILNLKPVIFDRVLQRCEYPNVIFLFHGAVVDLAAVAKPIPCHTAPKHQRPSTMLDCWLHI
ncbi:hypothetical protein BC939DRAFT_388412, partial [Gamsiella multidivaricata]|uniref:uncharacterized protein n=1 Tax=Gamsiella multidivaricata TaxID=101098 RepID=UPI00221F4D87